MYNLKPLFFSILLFYLFFFSTSSPNESLTFGRAEEVFGLRAPNCSAEEMSAVLGNFEDADEIARLNWSDIAKRGRFENSFLRLVNIFTARNLWNSKPELILAVYQKINAVWLEDEDLRVEAVNLLTPQKLADLEKHRKLYLKNYIKMVKKRKRRPIEIPHYLQRAFRSTTGGKPNYDSEIEFLLVFNNLPPLKKSKEDYYFSRERQKKMLARSIAEADNLDGLIAVLKKFGGMELVCEKDDNYSLIGVSAIADFLQKNKKKKIEEFWQLLKEKSVKPDDADEIIKMLFKFVGMPTKTKMTRSDYLTTILGLSLVLVLPANYDGTYFSRTVDLIFATHNLAVNFFSSSKLELDKHLPHSLKGIYQTSI